MSIVAFIQFFIAVLQIGFLIVLLLGGRDRSSRAFGLVLITHTTWVVVGGLLDTLDPAGGPMANFGSFLGFTSVESFAHALEMFIYYVGSLTGATFLYFALAFTRPNEKKIPLYIPLGLIAISVSLIPFYLSGSVVYDAVYIGGLQGWAWEYGSLWFLFDLFFFTTWLGGLYIIWKQHYVTDPQQKKNLRFMFWAMVSGLIPASLLNVMLPRFGYFELDWFGPIAGIGWLAVLFYSVIKYKQMNVRTVLGELLVVLAGIIVFVNILIAGLSENITAAIESIVKAIVFGTFVVVGHRLISNIFEESKRKQELERLNNELADLHDDLEHTVLQRTHALSEAKLHSETILENLTLGVIEYDDSFTVLRVNRAAEKILGVGRNTIVGNIIQPQDKRTRELSSLATVLYPALSGEGRRVENTSDYEAGTQKNEVSITHPKKRDLHVVTVELKDTSTRNGRYIKLVRDVTQEKYIERSKSEFIKIAAHQLRTPLSGTKWALRTTLDEDFGPLSQRQEKLGKKAYDMNRTLIAIVNDLLNVTKIEEHFGYRKKSNDMVSAVKEALLSSFLLAQNKHLSITMEKTTGSIPYFDFDYIKILIAIKNVVANAIDYTPENGSITAKVTVEDDNCVVEIHDTGIGIDKDDIKHVFTKFFRAKKAQEIIPLRSGLGLYITKNIVEMHNGTIEFNNRENGGLQVRMTLPMQNQRQSLPSEDTADSQ